MSKIIINNYSDVADEEVVGRVLKTMNEYKKYRSWVQDGELKRKVIGYHHSEQKDLNIQIIPNVLKTGTIKFDVY